MSLCATELAIGYPDRRVGEGFTLTLPPGQVTVVLGPNGSGKSTLIKTLLGLLPPRAGRLELDGAPLSALPDRDRARRLAYVPQTASDGFGHRVIDTVLMGRLAWHGAWSSPGPRDHDAAHEALRRLAIDDLAERRLSRLSGGERQLVLIARALAQQARWVLLDEPTANLDIAHQARVLRELARLRDDGLGVLFSSHDPNHAARIADQVLMIREGRPLACGPASGLLNARTLGELYDCPMLEVPGRFPAFFPA